MVRETTRYVPLVLVLAAAASCSGASGDAARGDGTDAERRRDSELAAGTVLELRARETLSSRHTRPGDSLVATTVAAAVSEDGDTVIPVGAEFRGTVAAIAPAENPREKGRLELTFTAVRFGGRSHSVRVRVTSMATQMQGRGVTTGDAAKVGAGAVAGGIAGRIIGGNKTGTLVGAAAGAAAGGVYAHHSRDIDIVLPGGGRIRVVLAQPFARPVARRSSRAGASRAV